MRWTGIIIVLLSIKVAGQQTYHVNVNAASLKDVLENLSTILAEALV